MPSPVLPYDVVFCSSHDPHHPVTRLVGCNAASLAHENTTAGWLSARHVTTPQSLVLRFAGNARLSRLCIVAHESKTASSVEVRVFRVDDAATTATRVGNSNNNNNNNNNNISNNISNNNISNNNNNNNYASALVVPPSFKAVRFTRLGTVAFSGHAALHARVRERKTIHMRAEAYFVRLLFGKPLVHDTNTHGQVGVYAIICHGHLLAPLRAPHADRALVAGVQPLEHTSHTSLPSPTAATRIAHGARHRRTSSRGSSSRGSSSRGSSSRGNTSSRGSSSSSTTRNNGHDATAAATATPPPLLRTRDHVGMVAPPPPQQHDNDDDDTRDTVAPHGELRSACVIAFDAYFVARVEQLLRVKECAIATEDYETASDCRNALRALHAQAQHVYELEQDKVHATLAEDFVRAHDVKVALEALLERVYAHTSLPTPPSLSDRRSTTHTRRHHRRRNGNNNNNSDKRSSSASSSSDDDDDDELQRRHVVTLSPLSPSQPQQQRHATGVRNNNSNNNNSDNDDDNNDVATPSSLPMSRNSPVLAAATADDAAALRLLRVYDACDAHEQQLARVIVAMAGMRDVRDAAAAAAMGTTSGVVSGAAATTTTAAVAATTTTATTTLARNVLQLLQQHVGRFATTCLTSRHFRLREAALLVATAQLQHRATVAVTTTTETAAANDSDDNNNNNNKEVMTLLPLPALAAAPHDVADALLRYLDCNAYGLQDVLPSIVVASCALVRALLVDTTTQQQQQQQQQHSALSTRLVVPLMALVPRLLTRAADAPRRVRETALQTLEAYVTCAAMPSAALLSAALAEPVDVERRTRRPMSNARVQLARLSLLQLLHKHGRLLASTTTTASSSSAATTATSATTAVPTAVVTAGTCSDANSAEAAALLHRLLLPSTNHPAHAVRDAAVALLTQLVASHKLTLREADVRHIGNAALREHVVAACRSAAATTTTT